MNAISSTLDRHPRPRRRRFAAAVLFTCATTVAGASFAGAATSRSSLGADTEAEKAKSCTITQGKLPIDVIVILDAAKVSKKDIEPGNEPGSSGTKPSSKGSSSATQTTDDEKYTSEGILAFKTLLEELISGSSEWYAYSDNSPKDEKLLPLLDKLDATVIDSNKLESMAKEEAAKPRLVFNLSTANNATNPDRSSHWISSTDIKPVSTLLAGSDTESFDISSQLMRLWDEVTILPKAEWSSKSFNVSEGDKVAERSLIFAETGENHFNNVEGKLLPFGNTQVAAVFPDGSTLKCSIGDDDVNAFPVALRFGTDPGKVAFLVTPPSSESGDVDNPNDPVVVGLDGLTQADSGNDPKDDGAKSQAASLPSLETLRKQCETDAKATNTTAATKDKKTSGNAKKPEVPSTTTVDPKLCAALNGTGDGGSSPAGMVGGGLAGLVVGAGVGVALMKSRRREEDNDGRVMAGHVPAAGGPGYPNSGSPYPGAPGQPVAPAAGVVPSVAAAGATPGRGVSAIVGGGVPTHEWTVAAPGGGTVRLDDIGVARVMPTTTEHGRVWAVGASTYAGTAGWLEKRKGKGEDAEPTLRVHASGRGIIGVYDGTGGAGAAPARTTGDGRDLSAAYVAARLVRDVVEAWFVNCIDEGDRALETGDLAATLQRVLKEEAQYLPQTESKVRGKLHRVLPTTAACIAFDAGDPAGTVDALWAGDSRCFVLTSGSGLQVLSKDDTRESDALELIRNDQPMENLVAADRPFRVNHRRFAVDRPMVLVTATDGAFGYVRTPAHFEYLLLHALDSATSLDHWSSQLLAAFSEFAADDVSFSVVAIGFDQFQDLQMAMKARHDYLAQEHWKPFVDNAGNEEAIERLRSESWGVYRDLYQARMVGPDATLPDTDRPRGQ